MEELYFEPTLRLLICKIHGYGVHPSSQAITRHLRGHGHWCRGADLKQALVELLKHPLASTEELLVIHLRCSRRASVPAVPHLQTLEGFRCLRRDCVFLTTSLELAQRHARKCVGQRSKSSAAWQACRLQTIFQETKFRRYFVVEQAISGGHESIDDKLPGLGNSSARPCYVTSNLDQSQTVQRSFFRRKALEFTITSLNALHPIAGIASQHVGYLSPWSLDRLFRSDAFRSASNPLFDPHHIDARRSMVAVFPGCEKEPVFWHALVYSTLQLENGTTNTTKGSMLAESKTIDLLNEKLSEPPATLSQPVLGAVALLKTTAYKLNNRASYNIHARGLYALLQACSKSVLTNDLQRALFWEDLYATIFVNSYSQMLPWHGLTGELTWYENRYRLPQGFVQHRDEIPWGLLKCIINTIELQDFYENAALTSQESKYDDLDMMQASIESRLVHLKGQCLASGIHVEAVRQATFLCCHCSWMEVWNDSFIPAKIGSLILSLVERSMIGAECGVVWKERWDILLWVLLIAVYATEKDQNRTASAQQQRKRVFSLTKIALEDCHASATVTALRSALHDFIYYGDCIKTRKDIADWADLEATMTAAASE